MQTAEIVDVNGKARLEQLGALEEFVDVHKRIFVLTGAGCSTQSGIPDYRDENGNWKQQQPMDYQTFVATHSARQRYWARSLLGWPRVGKSQPNGAHRALRRLEADGKCEMLVTQNVDNLHRAAGSTVIDLHGRLDQVRCLQCGNQTPRAALQLQLTQLNPVWAVLDAGAAPDGDAKLDGLDFSTFVIPACNDCGGILKPDVVFFGESVPPKRVAEAYDHLAHADAVLVVGSSLMVYSGLRFVDAAIRDGKPVAAVNLGRTRADDRLTLKVEHSCAEALAFLL